MQKHPTSVKSYLFSGNDLKTVLFLYSAFYCVLRFFILSSFVTVTTLMLRRLASFLPFFEVIPAFFSNFKHYYLSCVQTLWKGLFPQTFSYNRFIEVMSRCFVAMTIFLKLALFGKCTGISFVDSTCIPVIHNKRFFSMKVFKDIATIGESTMGWYIDFKLHLLCNEKGEIINFNLTRACVDDRDVDVMNALTDKAFGKLYANKGYISQTLFGRLWDKGVHIIT